MLNEGKPHAHVYCGVWICLAVDQKLSSSIKISNTTAPQSCIAFSKSAGHIKVLRVQLLQCSSRSSFHRTADGSLAAGLVSCSFRPLSWCWGPSRGDASAGTSATCTFVTAFNISVVVLMMAFSRGILPLLSKLSDLVQTPLWCRCYIPPWSLVWRLFCFRTGIY